MIDLFILYVVFSYLYMAGVMIDYYGGENVEVLRINMPKILCTIIIAPVIMPILIGMKQ
jgi:hypothetical protein